MCLILLAYNAHPRYRLVVAANRDEFYNRPTAPAAFWDDAPDVFAARDLRGALVRDFLAGSTPPARYLAHVEAAADAFKASTCLWVIERSCGGIPTMRARRGASPPVYTG